MQRGFPPLIDLLRNSIQCGWYFHSKNTTGMVLTQNFMGNSILKVPSHTYIDFNRKLHVQQVGQVGCTTPQYVFKKVTKLREIFVVNFIRNRFLQKNSVKSFVRNSYQPVLYHFCTELISVFFVFSKKAIKLHESFHTYFIRKTRNSVGHTHPCSIF